MPSTSSASYSLTGRSYEPSWGGRSLGGWAVAGFFCLSGYLITASRIRSRLAPYLWRRALRIFPAFWLGLVFVAFVAAPLSTLLGDGEWHPKSAVKFVLHDLALHMGHGTIEATLRTVPYPGAWNGSMWSLIYEFGAYLVVALLFVAPVARRHALAVSVAALVVLTVLSIRLGDGLSTPALAAQVGSFFAGGAVLSCARHRVHLSNLGAGAAMLALIVVWSWPGGAPVCLVAVPLAYALLWLGARIPLRWFSRNDISYGTYIFAFPSQQLVASATDTRSVWVMVTLSLPLTLALAAISWALVERPALRLAHHVPSV